MKAVLLTLSLLVSVCGFTQTEPTAKYVIIDTIVTEYYNSIWYTINGDTMVKATHSPIEVSAYSGNRHKKKQYDKLQKKVIRVYPYAKAAADVMKMYDAVCATITDPKTQERLLDQAEAEMKKQFEKDLRDMTVSEGVILIKLIDRQTGDNSYKLVQELKGSFSAFMWQSVARVFGHNLKDEYEAEGEDVWIENICTQIEDGTIPVQLKEVDPFGLRTYTMHQ
ncbi:MAG: DUF4294 domain-containing protein [Flavobacteriales bacterium]|nr:DUF4294 domain-containing protein [Flavobacteriales bacterium]